MASLHHLLLLSALFLPFCSAADPIGQYCDKSFTDPQIQVNIDRVLSDMHDEASIGALAMSTQGEGDTTVYGLAQCRRDVHILDCANCMVDAYKKLPSACPNQADARIWYDYCFLRYDTANFTGKADTRVGFVFASSNYVPSESDEFNAMVMKYMNIWTSQVSVDYDSRFATGSVVFSPEVTIYGLVQCMRDLDTGECVDVCLSSAMDRMPDHCEDRQGCQVLYSDCMMRYETYKFYFDDTSALAHV